MRAVFPQMGESCGNHTRTLEVPISDRLLLHVTRGHLRKIAQPRGRLRYPGTNIFNPTCK